MQMFIDLKESSTKNKLNEIYNKNIITKYFNSFSSFSCFQTLQAHATIHAIYLVIIITIIIL